MTLPHPARLATIALAVVAAAASIAATGADTTSAAAAHRPTAVTAWAQRHAEPLTSTDPTAALDDLDHLGSAIGDAQVVALGESAHGAAEETTLKHRVLRLLVEQLGIRTVAWEEDWTTGMAIDDYIHGGPQDLDQLVASMSPQYQTGEVADVLAWMRHYNTGRDDKVSFVGVEYYLTGRLAYDTVETYVATAAPERLDELRQHLTPLRPTSDDPFAHVEFYRQVPDKQPYLDNAHTVRDLVASIPHQHDGVDHAVALHGADQIVAFHEHYAMTEADSAVYREARAAESLRWWQQLTGERVAYWAASAHTADAPQLRLTRPGDTDLSFASAGSHLRSWYGPAYLSIGFTFDHGAVTAGPGQVEQAPPPAGDWFEAPLGRVDHTTFVLDLRHRRVPQPVRQWLHEPATTRGVAGPGSVVDGGSLAEWFDVLVHTQTVRPASPKRPGSCGGIEATERWSDASTEEVSEGAS